jgi:uncharacterized protein YjbJ (UPF0337 family)
MENENWTEMKTKIKSRWSKLTDENIESIKNDWSRLKSQLESTYGYSKEFAQKEYNQLFGKPKSEIRPKPPDSEKKTESEPSMATEQKSEPVAAVASSRATEPNTLSHH